MNTDDIRSFSSFTKDNASPGSVCFIDADENADCLRATAVLNYTSDDKSLPGHCDFVAKLNLQRTPEFKLLEKTASMVLSQKDLANYIEDNRYYIVALDEDRLSIPIAAAVGAIRQITIETAKARTNTVSTFKESSSTLESAGVSTDTALKLPVYLQVTTPTHISLGDQHIEVRISVRLGKDVPEFTLKIINKELLMRSVSEEFKKTVSEGLNGCIEGGIYFGSFSK